MRTTSSRRLAPANPTDAEMRPPSAGGDTQMEPPRSPIAQKRTLIAIPLMQVVADSSPKHRRHHETHSLESRKTPTTYVGQSTAPSLDRKLQEWQLPAAQASTTD